MTGPRSRWPAFGIPLAILALFVGVWFVARAEGQALLARQADQLAGQVAGQMKAYLTIRLAAARRLARDAAQGRASTRQAFTARARQIQDRLGGLLALYWIDAGGVIRGVVPDASRQAAAGADLTRPGGARATYLAAVRSGRPRLSPPLHLLQGGRGGLAVYPAGPGRADGLTPAVGAAIRFDTLVQQTLSPALRERFAVVVADGAEVVSVPEGSRAVGAPHLRSRWAAIRVAGRRWRVALAPGQHPAAPGAHHLFLAAGGVLALSLFWLLRRRSAAAGRDGGDAFDRARVGRFRLRRGDGVMTEASEAMARIFGYDTAETFTAEFRMADAWVDPARAGQLTRALEQTGAVDRFDARLRRRDGSPAWIRLSARSTPGRHELEGVAQNIDQEKRTALALSESERRLRTLGESTSAMIFIADARRRIIYANTAALEHTGYSLDQLTGMRPDELHDPESRARLERFNDEHREDRSLPLNRLEVQLVTAAGTRRWFEMTTAPIELDGGPVELSTYFDITKRKLAEEALRGSEVRYRTIFETTGTATIICDEAGVIVLANAGFAALSGHGRGDIEGQMTWADFFVEDDGPARGAADRIQTWDSVIPESYEVTLRDRHGRDHLGIVTVNLIPGSIQRVASFLDLTERRQAERQMFRAEKMAALGQIIAGVAHEINNPNNFIFFNLPVLARYVDAMRPLLEQAADSEPELKLLGQPFDAFMEDLDRLLQDMQHGSSRISEIVAELKAHVGDDESAARRPADLKTVIDHVMTLVGKQVRKMVATFEVDLEQPLPAVLMRPGEIEQVLINLVMNAGQAADKKDAWVRLLAARDPDHPGRVLVQVADNGHGIAPAVIDNIFDPFFTTKGRDAGTGLGLSISRRIIAEHQGTLSVSSEPGAGSRFSIRLPAHGG